MKNISSKNLIIVLAVILGMGLVFYLATSVVPNVLVTMSRASSYGKLSLSNSYLLGEKILANSDGIDTCVINVFLLDTTGKGIPQMNIELTGMENIEPVSVVSDKEGKGTFSVASAIEGQFTLTATANGSPIPKTIKVTFRKQ
jgi:hypothetical protein